ncbi:MAG TPA: type IV toxin-antitoxin system AbiEi family antitoxin domain-containing protein [Nocardioidaceae bacterium]|nr:type IV toxin-antitoxin system AbiEi family antitoxin domain-containing protein [Nocardioidaceae bacterium]
MDALRVIARTYGVFLRSEARDFGYDDRAVKAAIRAREWVRVRRGAYTFRDVWESTDDVGRHRILARAVMRSLGGAVALSHVSALAEHGIAIWGMDLSRVHVTRLEGGAGRTEKDLVHHEGLCLAGDVMERDGLRLMAPGRAVIEASSLATAEAGIVSTDSALHLGLVDPDELDARLHAMGRWPYMQKVHVVLRFADGRSESVAESRSRHLFWRQGLPAPELQFYVYDEQGALIGITDFAWPEHGLLGEFDGKVKYGRLLKEGEEPGDAVFGEKRREDLLREVTRWAMIRLVWADLFYPAKTAARIRRLMARAA